MSTAAPNDAAPTTPGAPAPTTAPGAAPAPAAPSRHRLSTFLKVSIILLAALSISAIALVFVGDFEGKVERITATFLIFAVFVGLTALDTSRGQRNSWYAPVALIANSYILALLLIVTWMSDGGYFLAFGIFWKAILVIAVTRAVVACCQVLLNMGRGSPRRSAASPSSPACSPSSPGSSSPRRSRSRSSTSRCPSCTGRSPSPPCC
ncbi:hypothetical protein [Leucobacter soli]|uniref:hypothetical protein n=1 Tax=Leucobacter soli TaxID=2812850 RepID=UPI0036064C04